MVEVKGQIVDLVKRRIVKGRIQIQNGFIINVKEDNSVEESQFILPGFVDAHIHVESSMLIPSEFARLAVVHGTIATVSDPHEIANVLGVKGIQYMIENGKKVPFNFFFGASSCVPATPFETAGACLGVDEIAYLFDQEGLKYLSEMMNYPAVLQRSPLVMDKIRCSKNRGLPVDGHAPGLCGEEAKRYIEAGISTDHECFQLDEALDKIKYGMKILIREGSAAKNYCALHPLLKLHPDRVMFCSDDKHPHELVDGHINQIVRRSIVDHGYDFFDVLRAACVHPVEHYKLGTGLLQQGDPANFIVVGDLREFEVLQTYIRGQKVAERGVSLISSVIEEAINNFEASPTDVEDFAIKAGSEKIRVIEALEGQLITRSLIEHAKIVDGYYKADIQRDLLKIAVVNRYKKAPVAVGFIRGFGLKKGAIASCIAHDSHNIVAVGTTDEEICNAVNAIISKRGGISAVDGKRLETLPLPVAGIMTTDDGYLVAKQYSAIDAFAKALGSPLYAPFMTLSFMALLVIPSLKISDLGLFDGDKFQFVSLES